MAMHRTQLRNLIVKVLKAYPGLYSTPAVELVHGTIAQESIHGTYLRQLGTGPALGISQVEEAAFDWLKEKYQERYPDLANVKFEELEWNLWYAILFCRLRYHAVPTALPTGTVDQAIYWKQHYNTPAGKGTIAEYMKNYQMYVEGH